MRTSSGPKAGPPREAARSWSVERPTARRTDLLPAGRDARTAVHEYGGAAWWVCDGIVWFTDWADQRLYRLAPGAEPEPLTPEPATPRADRFADGDLAPDRTWIVCVRERHAGGSATEVQNGIVRLAAHVPSEPEVLVTGPDFVAAPRLSPDGRLLAWLQWNHPSMPWDDTELVVRDLGTGEVTVVAGGPGESVAEPRWQPDGSLWFISDRTDWWNLYRWVPDADIEPVVRTDAEIGVPGWTFGSARFAVLADGRVVFARRRQGFDALAVRELDGSLVDLDLPFSAISAVRATGPGTVAVVAGSPAAEPGVFLVDVATSAVEPLRPPRDLRVDPSMVSVPEAISFPSVDAAGERRTAHALFYPPTHEQFRGPDGELPPLLVEIHGGPTSAAVPALSLPVQYWTSRGFAVVDVNYGGSTGYGRAYREQLLGEWGVVDVADCMAAAEWLAARGRVDRNRLCIRGGSAGGYTTLAALARADTRSRQERATSGWPTSRPWRPTRTSSRAVTSTASSARTRKPARCTRSARPIHHVDRFDRPLIVLQGAEDEIVPPSQSELIVDALRARRRTPWPTCCSTGSSTGSGAPRTSAGRWTRSSASTPRCSASSCPRTRESNR